MLFREKLGLFDVTNLVVGAIVGSDIYIATAIGVNELGSASILAWVIAGLFAMICALAFAICARVVKQPGGPYAFVQTAFGHFPAFITGWMLWMAELAGLCVFPLAFVTYLGFFFPLQPAEKMAIIALFLAGLFFVNYFGIKRAARINDVLTIVKLFPLLLIIGLGLFLGIKNPAQAFLIFNPMTPVDWGALGPTIVIIFWAYVGFEVATIPSGEIKNPKKTIPKAIIIGMAIVMAFYLITNIALLMIAGLELGNQSAPLAYAASLMLGMTGAIIITLGALFSVSGSDESNTIGTSRLSSTLAADGYFPSRMARLHPRYHSPYVALLVQSVLAFVLVAFFDIHQFIIFSAFNFAFVYLLVTLAAFKVDSKKDLADHAILTLSVLVCSFLLFFTRPQEQFLGLVTLAVGLFIYPFFSKKEMREEQAFIRHEEQQGQHMIRHEEAFLANVFKHFKIQVRKMKGLPHAHSLRERPLHPAFKPMKLNPEKSKMN